jgi:acylphosphatase
MTEEKANQYAVRVRITGRVQGVCYRAWAQSNARALGLNGWVRNLRDGAVEALFSGADGQVFEMLARCRKGPPAAFVENVAIIEEDVPAPMGFRVLPDV